MIDIMQELAAIHRSAALGDGPGAQPKTIALQRVYRAEVADVWEAITDQERLSRWFMPVTGDLKSGGSYQLEGNAGGKILFCEPPSRLKVTWILGAQLNEGDISEVEVNLTSLGAEQTKLELTHIATVPAEFWDNFGPGAVGVGWDLSLIGLGRYLSGQRLTAEERAAWEQSDEGRQYATGSSEAWGDAMLATGAGKETTAAMVINTTNFYAPPQ
jgi:uncharacterized protein YndB with AHSA1/START domain